MDWTHRIRLRHLEMLQSISETRNISRSAQLLNITQPALSKWLKDLETDLGLPLFERHSRGLRPTRYGAVLIDHARRITAHLDAVRDDMAAMQGGGAGRIVIGTSGASVGSTAPMAVLQLMALYPQASIELVEGPMNRLLERLETGELDVVVGRTMAQEGQQRLLRELLYEEPVAFLVRPGHPLLDVTEPVLDDLMGYRWIVWPKGTPIRDTLDGALEAIGQSVPARSVQSSTVTLNLTLMANSDLICLASLRDAKRYASWTLAQIVPFTVAGHSAVSMYWRNDGDNRPSCLRQAAQEREDVP